MLHFICHTHNLTLAHPLQLFLQKLLLFSRFLEFFFPVCKCRFFCFDFCLQLAFPINLPVQFIPQIFILTDILNKLGRNAIAFVVNPVINPDLFITGIPEFQNRRSKEIIVVDNLKLGVVRKSDTFRLSIAAYGSIPESLPWKYRQWRTVLPALPSSVHSPPPVKRRSAHR